MKTHLINGRALARRIRTEASALIRERDLKPGLAVILVGDDPASHLYVNLKERACADAGILFEKVVFPADAQEEVVLNAIETLNKKEGVHGILVQLPLPDHIDETKVIQAIDPVKDVDGFHPETNLVPGLATGILMLAKEPGIPLSGKSVSIIANSDIFRTPLEKLFLAENALVIDDASKADIVVIAVGKPHSLTKEMIKPGAIVVDVGTNRIGDTVVGDAANLEGVAGAITPVPGGVGPMTVAMLIRNTVELASRQK